MNQEQSIRWLHLSDLHMGCRGKALWWQMQHELEHSITEMVPRVGAPDLILLTGDLSYSGKAEEFLLVDQFLDTLLGWLRNAGVEPEPMIIPVPGNHDLKWPQGRDKRYYRILEDYHKGADDEDIRLLDEELWDDRDASFFEPLFGDYCHWFEQSIRPRFDRGEVNYLHLSHFPGDLCVELTPKGRFPLCVVGLNSAWLQYTKGGFQGHLELPIQQFHAALRADDRPQPLDIFGAGKRYLLMMHHPPGWLSKQSRKTFHEAIYTPDRFDLCLYGHMHKGRAEGAAISGGKLRYYFQSPSLFGLEHYGTKEEDRAMGYVWGKITAEGKVHVWPLKRITRGGGEAVFDFDQSFEGDKEGGVQIRPLRNNGDGGIPAVDLNPWLEALLEQTSHINISGIGAAPGKVKTASRYPIEQLYTTLRSRAESLEDGAAMGIGPDRDSSDLATLLPRHSRLLIEGQPGAGKTTFLRFVASMLARDLLRQECPESGAWRERYLGLTSRDRVHIPVFLRLGGFSSLLTKPPTLQADCRERLLDLIECTVDIGIADIPRAYWRQRFEKGDAILLLDGLDEVGDEDLRQRVFDILRDACTHWKKCSIVITSRPIQTAELRRMGFHLSAIEPFTENEISSFIDLWVAALHESESNGHVPSEARSYRDRLLSAIVERPRIRRMATNPVMLTCLCVVHWNEGELPEGRSRVYRAVQRWLIAARSELRAEQGFTDRFAERAFALLALRMMMDEQRKRSMFDLNDGVMAVDAVVAREFPGLCAEDRRHKAREWLRFECLWSGIIEEVSNNRIRFWHLTFQEYLAALQLAWLGDGEDADLDWWPTVEAHLDDSLWRETIELFPGCLFDEGGEGRLDRLLQRVLAMRTDKADLATDARVAGIMGRLVEPLSAYQYKPPVEIESAYCEVLDRSLDIFTVEGASKVSVDVRIKAAEALGRGGDPRLRHGLENLIEIPGLGDLRLGKYPVTVEEYREFVDHGGYQERRYWKDDEGWVFREKESWQAPGGWDKQLETPNCPVVQVSWYEATAYCRWLGEQWGENVRLPTQAEWEKAATPLEGKYPWGTEEPDEERANFDKHVGSPTSVGIYPSGNGPYGHCDLAGNVWEWCRDEVGGLEKYRKEYGPWRALRGGACSTRLSACSRPSASGTLLGAAATTSAFALPSFPRALDLLIFICLLGSRGVAPGNSICR